MAQFSKNLILNVITPLAMHVDKKIHKNGEFHSIHGPIIYLYMSSTQ